MNPPTYPVYCAWCPTDRRTIIGTATVPGSHGICPRCAELLHQGPSWRKP